MYLNKLWKRCTHEWHQLVLATLSLKSIEDIEWTKNSYFLKWSFRFILFQITQFHMYVYIFISQLYTLLNYYYFFSPFTIVCTRKVYYSVHANTKIAFSTVSRISSNVYQVSSQNSSFGVKRNHQNTINIERKCARILGIAKL